VGIASARPRAVNGYHHPSPDGADRHVEDFIIDDETGQFAICCGHTELVGGEKGPGFTAMDRARQLERVDRLRQS